MSSDQVFRLVPLDCPSCGAPVAADGEDVVYYCTACRNGYRFDRDEPHLVPIEVAFVALAEVAAEVYRPFWLLPARVALLERSAAGGGFSGLMGLFLGPQAAAPSEASGTFAVPAFHTRLGAVTELTRRYTETLPQLGEKLGEKLLGGRYGVADAQQIVHCAVVAGEIEQPDTLKNLRYEIEFGPARLLGVPFVRRGEVVADALFGIAV